MLQKSGLLICFAALTLSFSGVTNGEVLEELVSDDDIIVGQALLDYIEDEDMTVCLMDCWGMELGEDYTILLFDCDEYGAIANYVKLYGLGKVSRAVATTIHLTEGDFSIWFVAVESSTKMVQLSHWLPAVWAFADQSISLGRI